MGIEEKFFYCIVKPENSSVKFSPKEQEKIYQDLFGIDETPDFFRNLLKKNTNSSLFYSHSLDSLDVEKIFSMHGIIPIWIYKQILAFFLKYPFSLKDNILESVIREALKLEDIDLVRLIIYNVKSVELLCAKSDDLTRLTVSWEKHKKFENIYNLLVIIYDRCRNQDSQIKKQLLRVAVYKSINIPDFIYFCFSQNRGFKYNFFIFLLEDENFSKKNEHHIIGAWIKLIEDNNLEASNTIIEVFKNCSYWKYIFPINLFNKEHIHLILKKDTMVKEYIFKTIFESHQTSEILQNHMIHELCTFPYLGHSQAKPFYGFKGLLFKSQKVEWLVQFLKTWSVEKLEWLLNHSEKNPIFSGVIIEYAYHQSNKDLLINLMCYLPTVYEYQFENKFNQLTLEDISAFFESNLELKQHAYNGLMNILFKNFQPIPPHLFDLSINYLMKVNNVEHLKFIIEKCLDIKEYSLLKEILNHLDHFNLSASTVEYLFSEIVEALFKSKNINQTEIEIYNYLKNTYPQLNDSFVQNTIELLNQTLLPLTRAHIEEISIILKFLSLQDIIMLASLSDELAEELLLNFLIGKISPEFIFIPKLFHSMKAQHNILSNYNHNIAIRLISDTHKEITLFLENISIKDADIFLLTYFVNLWGSEHNDFKKFKLLDYFIKEYSVFIMPIHQPISLEEKQDERTMIYKYLKIVFQESYAKFSILSSYDKECSEKVLAIASILGTNNIQCQIELGQRTDNLAAQMMIGQTENEDIDTSKKIQTLEAGYKAQQLKITELKNQLQLAKKDSKQSLEFFKTCRI